MWPCEVHTGPCEVYTGPCEVYTGPCEVRTGPCSYVRSWMLGQLKCLGQN